MPIKQNVTVFDIAERVGLSKSEVAKVLLNNRSTIRASRENAERIRKVAAEMEYRPNTAERALELADAQRRRLPVSPVLRGADREQAALDSLIRPNADGILLKTGLFQARPEPVEQYAKCGIPIVTDGESHPGFSSVTENIRSGMRALFPAADRITTHSSS